MRNARRMLVLLVLAASAAVCAHRAGAQQVVVGAPFNNVGDSFYENFGASGSWSNGNAFFNWGGGGAIPPVGGYDPSADARFGFRVGGLNLNFTAGQGSDRFASSQTPMITLPNGGSGNLFNGSISPFVTSFVPVVGADGGVYGGGPTMLHDRVSRMQGGERPTPLKPQQMQTSSQGDAPLTLGRPASPLSALGASGSTAEVAAAGVSSQRAAYAAEATRKSLAQEREFRESLDRAQSAVAAGKSKLAKAYFDQALRNAASDDQRLEALGGLRTLESDAR